MFVIRDFWPTALLLPQFKLAKKFARYSELSRRARVDKAVSKGGQKASFEVIFCSDFSRSSLCNPLSVVSD